MSVMAQQQQDVEPAADHRDVGPDPMPRLRRWLLILFVTGAILWAIFAWVVVPPVIHSAYQQQSFEIFNNLLDHRDEHPVTYYLGKWNTLAAGALAGWVGLGFLLLVTTSRTFADCIVGTATPGTLGAIRMVVCLVLALMAARERVHGVVNLPAGERHTMGVMDLVYAAPIGFDTLVTSPTGLTIYKSITVAVLLLAAVGWRTRTMLILSALLYLPLMGIIRSYSWFSHSGIAPYYLLLVLVFTRSGDGWSIDRLRKVWRGEPVVPKDEPQPHYAWARYAIWTVLCAFYLAAGLSKIRNGGWFWWHGVNLQDILYTDALRGDLGDERLLQQVLWMPRWFFSAVGLGTLVIEIGIVLVLVSWWARQIFPILAALMHVGIETFQKILFLDLILIQVTFYDWRAIRLWLARRFTRRRGQLDVLFDGRCPICRRSVRVLSSLDLFERLHFVDFRELDLPGYGRTHGVTLSADELNHAMHVVWRGRATRGYDACRQVAWSIPLFWIVAPVLYLPGLTQLGRIGYRWLAKNRMAFGGCDDACTIEPPTSTVPSVAPPVRPPVWRRLIGPVAITGLVMFYVGVWALKVEYYPFTSVQMFSKSDLSGIVEHIHIFQTDEQGRVGEARLEKMGRGMARYHPVLAYAFEDKTGRGKQRCIEMLEHVGATWNDAAPQEQRVVRLEVVKYAWDFVNEPDDATRGKPVGTIVVEFDLSTSF